jgi:hypothetical protein
MPAPKTPGKAVALKRGHYPDATGRVRIVEPGEVFDLVPGKTTSRWFQPAEKPYVPPKPAVKSTPGDPPPSLDEPDFA